MCHMKHPDKNCTEQNIPVNTKMLMTNKYFKTNSLFLNAFCKIAIDIYLCCNCFRWNVFYSIQNVSVFILLCFFSHPHVVLIQYYWILFSAHDIITPLFYLMKWDRLKIRSSTAWCQYIFISFFVPFSFNTNSALNYWFFSK